MKLKKGIASVAYFHVAKRNYDEGMARMRSHGFEAVDFGEFADTESEFFKSEGVEFEKRIKEISDAAARQGVELYQCHGPWRAPIQDTTEEDRAERFGAMSKTLLGAAIMGCPNAVIHPIMPFGIRRVNEEEVKRTWDINIDYFTRLSEVARRYGVTICLENMPFNHYPISLTSDIMKLVKTVDSPNFKVCLDTGHSNMFTSPADDVRLIGGDYLRALHLHDNYGDEDAHRFPYEGSIDWQAFCNAVREVGFKGSMSFETHLIGHYPPEIHKHMETAFLMITDSVVDMVNK